jgi:hypothetical protein
MCKPGRRNACDPFCEARAARMLLRYAGDVPTPPQLFGSPLFAGIVTELCYAPCVGNADDDGRSEVGGWDVLLSLGHVAFLAPSMDARAHCQEDDARVRIENVLPLSERMNKRRTPSRMRTRLALTKLEMMALMRRACPLIEKLQPPMAISLCFNTDNQRARFSP